MVDNCDLKMFDLFFRETVVIIDDELRNKESDVFKIRELLASKGIPTIEYLYVPEVNQVMDRIAISFVILDWNFGFNYEENQELLGKIDYPNEMKRSDLEKIVSFLLEILRNYTVPVFLFTAENINEIKQDMRELGISDKELDSVLFCAKKDLLEDGQIQRCAVEWLKSKPGYYVVKAWERESARAKNTMFKELTSDSAQWPAVVMKQLSNDGDIDTEFTSFLNRQFVNRFNTIHFNRDYIGDVSDLGFEELRKIIQSAHYIRYGDDHDSSYLHTGDILKDNDGYYWIIVSAQCDLCRISAKKKKTEERVIIVRGVSVEMEKAIDKDKNKGNSSEFYEQKNNAYEMCIADEFLVEFDLSTYRMISSDCEGYSFVGRVFSPDITRIQQKFSAYVVREGVTSVPKNKLIELYEKETLQE